MASGIGISQDLASAFSSAVESKSVRFIKVSIEKETLVHDSSIPVEGTLTEDLEKLQSNDVLQDDVPAYILAKLDDPPTEWLSIYYVPETAKIKDKMLYATTRASLMKSLGSTAFTDSIFATSRADITPTAYAVHLKEKSAPQPLSKREQELADIRAAEREVGSNPYVGSQARVSHLGSANIGFKWTDEVEQALISLKEGAGTALVTLGIDVKTETIVLVSSSEDVAPDALGAALPPSESCYALYAWPRPSQRVIVFIYSCPSNSSVKDRMIYASSSGPFLHDVKSKMIPTVASRRIETSDPKEIDERFLESELGADEAIQANEPLKTGFAKPRGPARRPR